MNNDDHTERNGGGREAGASNCAAQFESVRVDTIEFLRRAATQIRLAADESKCVNTSVRANRGISEVHR